MTSAEYLNAVKDRLVLDPQIRVFQEGATRDAMMVMTYSYYWANADGSLIRRWDNTPHFPALPGFPHHCHHATGEVTPSEPMNIFRILEEMQRISTASDEE